MKSLTDLPTILLTEMYNENPMFFDYLTLNQVSGGILWKGKK